MQGSWRYGSSSESWAWSYRNGFALRQETKLMANLNTPVGVGTEIDCCKTGVCMYAYICILTESGCNSRSGSCTVWR